MTFQSSLASKGTHLVGFLAFGAVALGSAACVGNASDAEVGTNTSKDTAQSSVETLNSALENEVIVTLYPDGPSASGCAGAALMFDYFDTSDVFGSASSIDVWYSVTASSGAGPSATVTMATNPNPGSSSSWYRAYSCLESADVQTVTFAFANTAKNKWDSNNSQNYSLSFAPAKANPTVSFTTAIGNAVTATVDLTSPANENCGGGPALELDYTDKTNFFGGASAIKMWIRFHNDGHDESATVNLPSFSGMYETTRFCLDTSEAGAQWLEMAFGDEAGAKWDSNNSQNYSVQPQ